MLRHSVYLSIADRICRCGFWDFPDRKCKKSESPQQISSETHLPRIGACFHVWNAARASCSVVLKPKHGESQGRSYGMHP